MNNLHWIILASDLIVPQKTGGGVFHCAVDIQVKHQSNEEEAIKRAKELIKRKYYKLRSVLECDCTQHNLQHRRSLEVAKKTQDALIKIMGHEEDNRSQWMKINNPQNRKITGIQMEHSRVV